jgi:hypothetical protein
MPAHRGQPTRERSDARIRPFIYDSFVRIFPGAPRELAGEGHALRPQDFRCDSGSHTTWTRSVDQLVGHRR